MKHSATIAGRNVCSNSEFILFSNTRGLVGEVNDYQHAKAMLTADVARHAERGQETDAFLFQWAHDHWRSVGSLYDIAPAGPTRIYAV